MVDLIDRGTDMTTGLAIGFAMGLLIGAAGGAALMRYGMGLGEKMAWGAKEGRPALTEWDAPLEQNHTNGATDTDEDLEVEP